MDRVVNWNIWMVFDYFTNLFSRNSIRAVVMLMVMLLIAACLFILSDIEHGENRKKQLGIVCIVGVFVLISFAVKSGMSTSKVSYDGTGTSIQSSTDKMESEEAEPKEERDELIVALPRETYIPYIYWDDNGNLAGVDYAIAQAIADQLNMKLSVEMMEYDEILLYVQNAAEEDKFCIGMGVLNESERALQMVDYSTVYNRDEIIGVVRGDDITDPWHISEDAITGTQGQTPASVLAQREKLSNCYTYRNQVDLMRALQDGVIDVAYTDRDTTILAEELGMIVPQDQWCAMADHKIAVVKDELNEPNEYLECINHALAELERSGDIADILEMYNYKVARAEISATEYSQSE